MSPRPQTPSTQRAPSTAIQASRLKLSVLTSEDKEEFQSLQRAASCSSNLPASIEAEAFWERKAEILDNKIALDCLREQYT